MKHLFTVQIFQTNTWRLKIHFFKYRLTIFGQYFLFKKLFASFMSHPELEITQPPLISACWKYMSYFLRLQPSMKNIHVNMYVLVELWVWKGKCLMHADLLWKYASLNTKQKNPDIIWILLFLCWRCSFKRRNVCHDLYFSDYFKATYVYKTNSCSSKIKGRLPPIFALPKLMAKNGPGLAWSSVLWPLAAIWYINQSQDEMIDILGKHDQLLDPLIKLQLTV